MHKVRDELLKYSNADKATKKEHVKAIRNNSNKVKAIVRNNLCPWCGSELVDRKGKYGGFKGCSSYPKCKYILK